MKRRDAVVLGAAVTGGAAGIGWSLRSWPPAPANRVAELWSLQLPQPEGGTLALVDLRSERLLINFWATWCAPCIRELPALDRFHRAHVAKGWQVVGLAVDNPEPVRQFLKRLPLGFAIAIAGVEGLSLSQRLGNDAGGLPFTVVVDRTGLVLHRKTGETHYDELLGWVASM